MNEIKSLARNLINRLHQGELNLANSILRWKIRKEGKPEPPEQNLEAAAASLLEEAREIARRRGKSLYEVLKDGAKGFFSSQDS